MAAETSSLSNRRRILVVDDEPMIRDLLVLTLRQQGFELESCVNGLEAWHRISSDPANFDLVITDNQMPEVSGLELVQLLRESNFPGKVMFFSSTLGPKEAEQIARLRVDAMVEKGSSMPKLLGEIARVLA